MENKKTFQCLERLINFVFYLILTEDLFDSQIIASILLNNFAVGMAY